FEGVMCAFNLFINEKKVGEFKGGYIPHFIEITNYVDFKEENEILVEVDSREREDIPPFGNVIDYLTFGGIYRDVCLYELNHCFIENILYKYEVLNINNGQGKIKVFPKLLINNKLKEDKYKLNFNINNKEKNIAVKVSLGKKWYELEAFEIGVVDLWSIDTPNLYEASCALYKESLLLDENVISLGFRKVIIKNNGLFINDEKVKIFGLNRHQSFPYMGYAMPKRSQEKDADILKEELALNLVRTSHYPQSPYFLNRCDEIGLLVLEEIPGWQFISGREDWRQQVLRDVEGMILRDYNHPAIITWGVRINESWDDEELYTKTNDLARSLDQSRKTCGIRYLENSQFLEDIYTMNDFIHWGEETVLRSRQQVTGLEREVPYLVTEFCGHIYPTKKFDQEERLVEHTLRHGRVMSKARESKEYLGAIGWCAFDYNTHYDFGSGDRICYHGVMDMFRIPKMAASIYKSQQDNKKEAVLEPLTYWSRGERDRGEVFPIYVCTNCDEIKLKFNDEIVGEFKRSEETIEENLKHLKYPPIKVTGDGGEWGAKWTGAEFVGYIDGEEVIRKKFCVNPIISDLEVNIDDKELKGNEFDATRVVVKVVDEEGNNLPFVTGSINVEVEGDIELIGPKWISLIGGSIAFWVKTLGEFTNNKGVIKINSSFNINKQLNINIK
ncbi:glycoside hydrolase family 2 TIM barrel-domain containing protein, partial [Clostridium tarantellae]